MDINDTIAVFFNHFWRNHYKESCQHNQIWIQFIHLLQKFLIECCSVGIIFWGNAAICNSMFFSPLKCICIFIIADHACNLRIRNCPIFHRINNSLKIRSATGFLPLHPYLRGYSAQSLRHREWRTLQSRIRKKSAETAPEPPQEEGFTPADEVEKKSIPALLRVLQEYPSSRFSNPSKSIFHGINDARNCTVKGAGQQIRAHTLI